ncbi:uncharacterized protein I206_105609 [Kwoniella pini CBS 10737]|uniref:FAS1 domain-containing protein n=1 Tax=Kwoniella pini CBS 10737 TaxID=1296096 RepID=A0A1B9I3R6_9TREE|nr:uncharacterized protein I206_03491 [Kwoniella pini CBS 10737]OCF50172.1 hypothetical protein I206_03491 [Kwoniella pini CBS 10737]
MRLNYLIYFLTIFSINFKFGLSQLDDDLICPNEALTEYLTNLLDILFSNGLTTFEQLLVHYSENDLGYEFLNDLYNSNQKLTLLVPTNQAFNEIGINSPFIGLTEDRGMELGELHLLQGDWTSGSLPQLGHGIASTSLLIANELNQTDSKSNAYQAVTLEKGNDNSIIIDGWWGNSTSWNGPLDLSSSNGLLDNLMILPIDQVLSFPPSLSTALQSPGLTNMSSALNVIGKSQELEQLTENGFTIFVPLDSVWDENVKNLMTDSNKAMKIIQNHYTRSYTLFSPGWTGSDSMILTVESGEQLIVSNKQDGSNSVKFGDIEANIIRSDITLNNGVMHIIDKILFPTSSSNSSETPTSSIPSTAQPTGTTSASIPDGQDTDKDGGKAVIPDASGSSSASKSQVSVQLLVCVFTFWFILFR